LPPVGLSIRWRLALLYTIVLALCLLASDLLVYVALQRFLMSETDESLASQAQEIAGTTRIQAVGGPSNVGLFVLPPDIDVFSSPGVFVQVLNQRGEVEVVSANMSGRTLPVSESALERAHAGVPSYETIFLESTPARIYYYPLNYPPTIRGELVGVVQVGRSLRDIEATLGRLRLSFAAIGVLSLIVATLGGWWLARTALRPIDRLTRDAHAIGESRDFGRRVADLEPRDEVGRLATTFNEMLGQLQEAYDELEATLAAQQRFVADASHELRTPLATVRTNLELLQRAGDSLAFDDREEAMADAVAEIERLSRLVASLLTLARVDSGLRLERREAVAVDRLVRDVYRQARLMALPREQRVVLDEVVDADVEGDPDYLKELLLILVDNAVSYTPEGGEVRLRATRENGWIRTAVSDTGIGIDPVDVPRLFERFYRADQARARGEMSTRGGTGLGLSIAKWIVDEHGGAIRVESQVGRGSTFEVELPELVREHVAAAVPSDGEAVAGSVAVR
jgi:signal transduction histidine kinase